MNAFNRKRADFTDAEIAEAQTFLDEQPSFSPFWDTSHAQEVMEVISVCRLVATTTETERRQMHNDAMRAARAEAEHKRWCQCVYNARGIRENMCFECAGGVL